MTARAPFAFVSAPVPRLKPYRSPDGALGAFAISAAQDATFGTTDEALAFLGAATQPYLGLGNGASAFSDRYRENLDSVRSRFKENADAHPVADFAGGFAGLLIPGAAAGKAARLGLKELAERSAKAAVSQARQEGARGVGDGEGGFGARVQNGLKSAAWGAGGGLSQPGLARGAANQLDKIKSPTPKAAARYLRQTDGENLPHLQDFIPDDRDQVLPRFTGPDTRFHSLSPAPSRKPERRGLLDFW